MTVGMCKQARARMCVRAKSLIDIYYNYEKRCEYICKIIKFDLCRVTCKNM